MSTLRVSALTYSYNQIIALIIIAFTMLMLMYRMIPHLPLTLLPPETGFSSASEEAQYDKLVAAENNSTTILKGFGIGLYGLFAALSVCLIFTSIIENRRRVIHSSILEGVVYVTGRTYANKNMADGYGHVNYIATMLNLDWLRQELMRAGITVSLETLLKKHRLAFVVYSAQANYLKQIRLGEEMEMVGAMRQLTSTRMQLNIEIRTRQPYSEGIVAVKSNLIMALIDLDTGRPQKVPEWLLN